jgi:CubicO group peptidase (beta-lactamase class C family)
MKLPKIDQLAKQGKFSGSVLVVKNSERIFDKAVGFANIERKIPNSLDTKYNLGSMNKMFTAVAIAQLAQLEKRVLSVKVREFKFTRG